MTGLNIKEFTMENIEEKTRVKYLNLFKLFLTLSLILTLTIIVIGIGVFAFGPNWAILGLDIWIYLLVVIMLFFTILELTLYYRYTSIKNNTSLKKMYNKDYINGKKIVVFKYPKGSVGGVFSKTYIPVDKNHVLILKSRMVPPKNIW